MALKAVHECMGAGLQVAAPHGAFDKESAVGRRQWLLIMIKTRLSQLALGEEIAAIINTTVGQSAKPKAAGCGRYSLTPRQIEQRIEAKFKLSDTKQNRQRIYELTQKLKRRREEYRVPVSEDSPLTRPK